MESDREKLVVDGYTFDTLADADLARSEILKIKKINTEFQGKSASDMLEFYNKLIEKNIFRTIIGYNYLHEVRKILKKNPAIDSDSIKPVRVVTGSAIERESEKERKKILLDKNKDLREKIKCSVFVNIVLIIVIVIMFVISYNSKIFDVTAYEQQIQDKYSSWEESLNERESQLKEREK